ncbi:MAG: DivIVA domain-containing protein [Clostridia bacterium]|nr:DivIVA domain-containing protein [Clostridia bacterium]
MRNSGRSLKGYNVSEVDDFLDELTEAYEKLYKENAELKDKIENNQKDLEHYRNVEHTLQNTLVMAQTTAEDIKKMAQGQADQIVQDAQMQARKHTEDLSRQEFELRVKIEETKKKFDMYKAKMEALLISQLELLKDDGTENN